MVENDGLNIKINEGDFGQTISFNLTSGNILEEDEVFFTIRNLDEEILIKQQMIYENNKLKLKISSRFSQLEEGKYYWGILQTRDGQLINTLASGQMFRVVTGESKGQVIERPDDDYDEPEIPIGEFEPLSTEEILNIVGGI